MNPALFLIGCIGTRLLLTYLAMTFTEYLPYMSYIAALISAGFFYIFFTGSRPTGLETGGKPIWWNHLRPVHGFLYGLFAYGAIIGRTDSWKVLLADTMIGLIAFLHHHFFILLQVP
jgi:hypothetical protein